MPRKHEAVTIIMIIMSTHNAALKIMYFELLADLVHSQAQPYETQRAKAYWEASVYAESTELV